jgi:dolichol-phosphate mannosyltransferase
VPYTTESSKINIQGLSIILPTFNEAGCIETMVSSLLELTNQYQVEILVVDDDSQDGTADIVRKLARRDSRIKLIQRVLA